MVVVRGDDNQIVARFAVSLFLPLVAEDKNVGVEHLCHLIKQMLAVASAPRKKICRTRFDDIVDSKLSIENSMVKLVGVAVCRQ